MKLQTAFKYVKRFQARGFNAVTRHCIFIPGFKVVVDCSAPLLMEGISASRKVIRHLGRHNTTLACHTYQEARALIHEIETGKVTLPEI